MEVVKSKTDNKDGVEIITRGCIPPEDRTLGLPAKQTEENLGRRRGLGGGE